MSQLVCCPSLRAPIVIAVVGILVALYAIFQAGRIYQSRLDIQAVKVARHAE